MKIYPKHYLRRNVLSMIFNLTQLWVRLSARVESLDPLRNLIRKRRNGEKVKDENVKAQPTPAQAASQLRR